MPPDGPDGQVMAGPGPNVIRGGPESVQNDPQLSMLPPYFMKIGSKMHSWGKRCSIWQSYGRPAPAPTWSEVDI